MVIYKTINLVNGKIYIGKDSKNNKYYLGGGKLIKLAIKKYGRKNFKKEILEFCNSIDELNKKEKYWVDLLNSRDKKIGYNILVGGEKSPMENAKHTDLAKVKMSKNHVDVSGDKNPMFGKNFEKAWKENGLTDEEIKIKKETWLRNHNNFFKENNPFKDSKRFGDKNPFFGKKHSENAKKKISESRKKPVLQYSLTGDFIKEWSSPKEVYELLNIQCNNCCNGISKTACGFIWKYKEQVTNEN
jgi:group I intron endonuclease